MRDRLPVTGCAEIRGGVIPTVREGSGGVGGAQRERCSTFLAPPGPRIA
jgi:hypothetical protein